jgi:hypothetical protein
MAEPITFCGVNRRLVGAPGTEHIIRPLPTYSENGEHISCWKLDPVELKRVIDTGEVWVSLKANGPPQPIYISGAPLMEARDGDTGEQTVYHSDGRHVVEDARHFAFLHHGAQPYGESENLTHTYHLEKVVQVLRDFGASWEFLVAGYGHDLEEDCFDDLPIEQRRAIIQQRYGDTIEGLIWACTGEMYIDGVKQNRAARNAQQYAKIALLPAAAPVKCADRIANMEECVRTQAPRMGALYYGEVMSFDDEVGSVARWSCASGCSRRRPTSPTILACPRPKPWRSTPVLDEVTAAIVEATSQAA